MLTDAVGGAWPAPATHWPFSSGEAGIRLVEVLVLPTAVQGQAGIRSAGPGSVLIGDVSIIRSPSTSNTTSLVVKVTWLPTSCTAGPQYLRIPYLCIHPLANIYL